MKVPSLKCLSFSLPVVLAPLASLAFSPLAVNTLKFKTLGCDCYANGKAVMSGECYALVWQKNDVEFGGLPIDPPNPRQPAVNGLWVAEYFPVAVSEGGTANCPSVTVKGLSVDDDENGKWTVYLLDTRYELDDGSVVCGYDPSQTNAPRRINAYKAIPGLTSFTIGTSAATPMGAQKTTQMTGGDPSATHAPVVADTLSIQPLSVPNPAFSELTVASGIVRVCVTNTVPYLQYELRHADELNLLGTLSETVDFSQWGSRENAIIWHVPAKDRSFFRLTPRLFDIVR